MNGGILSRGSDASFMTGGIRYSQVWEDHLLLEEGLHVQPEDDVLSVTSAGDNVLALLLKRPRSITALDVNPAQQALLELKIAAIRLLDHDDYVALLGFRPCPDRRRLYNTVRGTLSSQARAFFDAHEDALLGGLCDSGRFESYVKRFAFEYFSRTVPIQAIEQLLASDSLSEQRRLFDTHFRPAEPLFRKLLGREALSREGRSEAQFRYVGDIDVGEALWRRFEYACTAIPARTNFYLEYLLTWNYKDLEAGPPYLRPSNFEALRSLVDRVCLVTEELGEHLARKGAGVYTKANLSDVFEYLSAETTEHLMQALGRVLRPGGRMAYWNLFVARESPATLRPPFRHLDELSTRLSQRDRSWFYQAFHVEEVSGDPAADWAAGTSSS